MIPTNSTEAQPSNPDEQDHALIRQYLGAQITMLVQIFGFRPGCIREEWERIADFEDLWNNMDKVMSTLSQYGTAAVESVKADIAGHSKKPS